MIGGGGFADEIRRVKPSEVLEFFMQWTRVSQ